MFSVAQSLRRGTIVPREMWRADVNARFCGQIGGELCGTVS